MNARDRRLIEDYIPIREISAEASPEKSIRKWKAPAEVIERAHHHHALRQAPLRAEDGHSLPPAI